MLRINYTHDKNVRTGFFLDASRRSREITNS